ncbi:MAG: L-threonylcarbamoyladenylate synthase [Acidobacteriota bacterium]
MISTEAGSGGNVATWRFGDSVVELAAAVARGMVLAIPTESSYGLGVDPRNRNAVETVYRIKHREPRRPLLVVVADAAQLGDLGVDVETPAVRKLLEVWPAPLTAVLRVREALPAGAGEATLAVRIPDDARLRALLTAVGPLTATSANLAGEPPLLAPLDLASLLRGYESTIVDAGSLSGGPPSTLVDLTGDAPRVLREGSFSVARFLELFSLNDSLNSTTPVEDVAENSWRS